MQNILKPLFSISNEMHEDFYLCSLKFHCGNILKAKPPLTYVRGGLCTRSRVRISGMGSRPAIAEPNTRQNAKKKKDRKSRLFDGFIPRRAVVSGTRFLDDSCCLIIKHAAHFFLTSSMASLPDKCSISNRRTSMCDSPFSNSFCNPASSPGLYRAPNKDAAYILSLSDPMI